MGSILGDLPSYDPHNFTQLRLSDPSKSSTQEELENLSEENLEPSMDVFTVVEFCGLVSLVIYSEAKNILLRHFYMRAEEKLRSKRAASESLTPEQVRKQPRSSTSEAGL